MRNTIKRAAAGAVLGGSLLFTGGMGAAGAAPPQNGLVNVAVGDITILQDVGVGVAANVAAAICGVQVGPVAVLANQVQAGTPVTVCTIERQTGSVPITITR
jgi:hypothetical protein